MSRTFASIVHWRQIVRWLASRREFPLSVKLIYTAFVYILIPTYWREFGPSNFLWVSDQALLLGFVALWLENRLLASMQAVSGVVIELAWSIDFLVHLTFGITLTGMSDYMFQSVQPLNVRALSLFHIPLPFFLLWMVYRLGYDRRALVAQTIFAWVVLLVTFFFTSPGDNINWTFGPMSAPQHKLPSGVYLAILMVLVPVCVYLPTHLLLKKFMSKPPPPRSRKGGNKS